MNWLRNSGREREVMETGLYRSFIPIRNCSVAHDSKRLVAPDPYVTAHMYSLMSVYGGSGALGLTFRGSICASTVIRLSTKRISRSRKFSTVFRMDGSGEVAYLLMKLLITILVVDVFLKCRCSGEMIGQLTYLC